MDSIEEKSKKKCGILAPSFPLARFTYLGFHRAYYPFGNTPSEDFLENCLENSQPSVLVLGCGDLRSCFYTLWTNFDSSISTAPKKFKGACFTLNDYSAAVLARDIIFLYLCLQLPEDSMEKKKWLSAMWAIWYCHELYPSHLNILDAALKALLEFSDTLKLWSSKGNPLHQLVRFTSSSCLVQIAGMWRMWLDRAVCIGSVQNMHESRKKQLMSSIDDAAEFSCCLSKSYARVHGDEEKVQAEKAAARAPEVRSYLEVGSCYAEYVADLKLPKKSQTKVNITMYERQDGMYTCHYGLMPFESYFHAVEFSPQYMASHQVNIPYDIIVSSASFKSKPFLANSFQQFSLWIQSSSSILKDEDITITFNFDCRDAIAFCQEQMQQNRKHLIFKDISVCRYDIITTSNLMDHLSPSNLVVACVPLLKDDGLLIFTSMCCKNCANTGEEFLNACFGFHTKLFPVVLGVRCISHEGSDYSNPVIIYPFLTDLSHTIWQSLPHVRKFLWAKVSNAQKLTFPQLPCIIDNNVTEALVNLVGSCAYGLLNYGPGDSKTVLSHNCIETALGMLERFIFLSDESTMNYSYWEPLCTALKHVVKPFLHCLQTQAQLHNIHAHLTISEKDCPVCQQKVLTNVLGLFCAKINLAMIYHVGEPCFLVFVHQCASRDPSFLLEEAQNGRDVHIFDSFYATTSGGNLQLNFFAPLMLARKRYLVTVAMVQRTQFLNRFETLLTYTSLEDIQIPWINYNFCQPELSSQLDLAQTNIHFGTVTSYACDSHNSETKISLSKAASETLSNTKLSTERISSSEVRLNCNSLTFLVNFSYPINHDSIKMEINSGVLTLSCERQCYSLEEERPCFIVSPDHQLSIASNDLNAQVVHSQSLMQMTRKESEQLSQTGTYSAQVQVKLFLQGLFEQAMSHSFFSISFVRNIRILIVVNKNLFDYQHKTPAIDLAFCFVDNFEHLNVLKKWESVLHSLKVQPKHFSLKETEPEYLKTVLGYFSRRTNGTLLSAGTTSKYAVLQKSDLDCAFTRCVLYFLLCDPDVKLYAVCNPLGHITADILPNVGGVHCTCCNRLSFTTKRCAACTQANYCSKKCQKKHWPKHREMCKKIRTEASGPREKCTYCKRASASLKKCTKCHRVQYCEDCQSRHWPKHKKVCGDPLA